MHGVSKLDVCKVPKIDNCFVLTNYYRGFEHKSTKRSTILVREKHTREMPKRKNIHRSLYATLKGNSLELYNIFNMTNLCQEQK
jgi:hypothetical protein